MAAAAQASVCGCPAPVCGHDGGALTVPLAGKSALYRLQAIACRPSPGGLLVDFIGPAQTLKSALGPYSRSDHHQPRIDRAEAVAALPERLDVLRGMFHGLACSTGLSGTLPHGVETGAKSVPKVTAMRHAQSVSQRWTNKYLTKKTQINQR